jgi:H+-translocating NAD(P) transhydrogenase subunit alpha
MIIGVVKETFPGERRVALIPAILPNLTKAGVEVLVEAGAGTSAGFLDAHFTEKGAKVVTRQQALTADVLLQVRSLGANPQFGHADLEAMRPGQAIIGMCDPLGMPEEARVLADRGVTLFALELIPRITRAQSMDVLSSMATIAGYRAVLLAATHLPKMFPMLTTAAGTVTPAKVFIMGAGVAGLQAIASARRLGAVVSANDVRSAVKEQVQSLGAKFVEVPVDQSAEGQGGYAKAMDEEFYRKQRELLSKTVAESDVVITTALIPGKPAPKLVTADMVRAMQPGSVIVDLAAERGGNCELTRPGETANVDGITILGPTNLPSEIPYHASQMFAKNITTFLLNMVKDGQLKIDTTDEIVRDTLISMGGKLVNRRVAEVLSANR